MRVKVFVTCLVDTFRHEIGESLLKIFDALDIEVVVPGEQTCCGQPAYNAGYVREAKRAAIHFLDVFDGEEPIVCPSGSCASMVKHQYPRLFPEGGEILDRANRVAGRIWELTQFLVRCLGIGGDRFSGGGRITYHASCHTTRHLGVVEEPIKLLAEMRGVELVPLPEATLCCGFGGLFMAKLPEVSCALAEEKADSIISTGADWVTGCDAGCLLNIEDALKRKGSKVGVKHISQILAEGLP